MSRLQKYCDEKLDEAIAGKNRATNYLKVVEAAIEKGESIGPTQRIYTQEDVKRAKDFIEHWDNEIKAWEAERKLLNV